MAVKKKKYQAGGTTTPPTLEQRHDPTLTQTEKMSGAFPQMGPSTLPSGTEVAYTPQPIATEELQTTTGKQLGTTPSVTGQAAGTVADVITPTAPSPGTYAATTVANSVSDANAQLGSLSQGAITAPQGSVSQQALATAAQGTSAQVTAPSARTLTAGEQFTAAAAADVGGFQTATAEIMNTPQEATVQYLSLIHISEPTRPY